VFPAFDQIPSFVESGTLHHPDRVIIPKMGAVAGDDADSWIALKLGGNHAEDIRLIEIIVAEDSDRIPGG